MGDFIFGAMSYYSFNSTKQWVRWSQGSG